MSLSQTEKERLKSVLKMFTDGTVRQLSGREFQSWCRDRETTSSNVDVVRGFFLLSSSMRGRQHLSCPVLRPPSGPNARPQDNMHLT